MSKKQIIVIGMYRSGTSLIGGTLAKLGIDVGRHENLSHPTINPKGYWECFDSIETNEKLRKFCGDRNSYNVTKDDINLVIDNKEANKLVQDYITQRNTKDVWAVKDPKMIPFYLLYDKYLENPHVIFITRKKESVIESWKKIKPSQAELVPRAYDNHIEMLRVIKDYVKEKDYPILEIDYSWYVDNRPEAAKRIADFVGVPVNQEAIDFCTTYSGGRK